MLARYLLRPQQRAFWLWGVDVTSHSRPFARTLTDRGYVYHPNAVAGNKPVTIGHQYSTVALLPEKEPGLTASWVAHIRIDNRDILGQMKKVNMRLIWPDFRLWNGSQGEVCRVFQYERPG